MELDNLILLECRKHPEGHYFKIIDIDKSKEKGVYIKKKKLALALDKVYLEIDLKKKKWTLPFKNPAVKIEGSIGKIKYTSLKEFVGIYHKKYLKKMVSNILDEIEKKYILENL